jgi:hypothetical protein
MGNDHGLCFRYKRCRGAVSSLKKGDMKVHCLNEVRGQGATQNPQPQVVIVAHEKRFLAHTKARRTVQLITHADIRDLLTQLTSVILSRYRIAEYVLVGYEVPKH